MHPAIPPLVAALLSMPGAHDETTIVLDGSFDDWSAVPVAIEDAPDDAPGAEIDFGQIKIAHDDLFVDLLIDLGNEVTLQRLDGRLLLVFDADGNARTGREVAGMGGVDLVVELSPTDPSRPNRGGMGAGYRVGARLDGSGKADNPYAIGMAIAPTHASRVTELRLDRGAVTGDAFSVKAVSMLGGRVADETDVATHALTRAEPVRKDQPEDPLRRPGPDALRLLTWNAEFGAIFKTPDPFVRTLSALDPEIVFFQELKNDNSAAQLQSLLNQHVGGRSGGASWHVVFGNGGGNLRCAVASRFPLENVAALDAIPLPGRNNRTIRTAGATMEYDGRRLLLLSTHLKCCGRAGSSEDITRRIEIVEIRNAIAAATAGQDFDGIIIGGDLNLVGSPRLLDLLAGGLDVDRSDMAIVEAYQIDARSNGTWYDGGSPFLPGRLDYLLYTDASIRVVNSFVYESTDLDPRWLKHHGLVRADSRNSTDHLPVVIDLEWKPEARSR